MPAPAVNQGLFSHFAIGAKVSPLGIGFEGAGELSRHFNVRAGGNFFTYNRMLTEDGLHYDATLNLRSAQASLDWFPFAGGFHVSPGVLIYNGNKVTGRAAVPANQTFTLGDTEYRSSASDPVSGTGTIDLSHAAPTITAGFGNMIPRSGRHISVPFEAGFAYVGAPKTTLHLQGTACDPSGIICEPVATTPQIQENVNAQARKIDSDISGLRFYPIVSIGISYKF